MSGLPISAEQLEAAKQRGMSIGNAVGAAATVAAGDPEMFFSILEGTVEAVLNLQTQYAIADAFPGTTVVNGQVAVEHAPAAPAAPAVPAAPAAPAASVPVVPTAAPAVPAPAIPGATPSGGGGGADAKAEALWREFFENPGLWQDVRASKTKPNGPDFKHTTKKNEKGYYLALWVGGQYPAPQWAIEQLRAIGVQGV